MNGKLGKLAAVLAVVIGAMAVVAGGQVLLGSVPDYTVINWLPLYNYTAGMLTVLVTSVLIWRDHAYALPIAVATAALHAGVMLTLLTAYSGTVAIDSLVAMTVRLVVWAIILTLMFLQGRQKRSVLASS